MQFTFNAFISFLLKNRYVHIYTVNVLDEICKISSDFCRIYEENGDFG